MEATIVMCSMVYALMIGAIVGLMCALVSEEAGLSFFNPNVLHKRFNVNWFGAYFIGILTSIICLPVAIFYWTYKLCTVGRR